MGVEGVLHLYGCSFNVYNVIFVFIWGLFLWETYLNLRQLKVAKEVTKSPEEIKCLMNDADFDKSRRYAIDKLNFDIVSGFYNILSMSVILHFQLIAWAWYKSKEHMLFICSHTPWSFGVTERSEISFSLLFTVYVALFQFFESLPWSYYRLFVVEERYGFNKQTVGFFIKDRLKALVVGLVIGLPIISVLIWIIKAGGRHFYIYAYGFTFIVSIIIMFVYPEFIAPIFDRYERFPDCELRTKIEELAASIDFPLKKLFVVEGSKRSSHSNAYFYGFGKNKRIVLFDTLIRGFKMSGAESDSSESADKTSDEAQNRGCGDDEEILAVLAHELGHWKLKHVTFNLVIAQINIFFMFFAFGQLVSVDQLFVDFGLPPSAAPMLIRLIVVFQFIFMPYSSVLEFLLTMLSRKFEFQADAFAVSLKSGEKLKSALLMLTKDNLSFPVYDWLYSMCNHSHPPITERMVAIDAEMGKKK
ncbi:CAAX prenyl protease 1 -like protein [Echinococcus granulosus]|nr:CAAX prenyl protease 1 -like protein [Echinococcus granulosus]CDS17478.1 caax prenyl protease 1 [Echinococcus granulosus]